MFEKLVKNNHADAKMVGVVVGIFVTLIISVLVLYSVASSTTFSTSLEQDINAARGYSSGTDIYNNTTSAADSTTDILDQAGTFFQIAPIIGIVVVAVIILGYVGKIGGA